MKLRLLVGIVGMLMLANIADAAPFAYVLNRGSSQVAGSVTVIDVGTNAKVGTPIAVTGRPYSLAVSPKGGRVYVANQGTTSANDQKLQIINADLLSLIGSGVSIDYIPGGMALNKAETRLFVADQTNSRIYVYDLKGDTITSVPIGYLDASDSGAKSGPEGIVLDETANRLYVANSFVNRIAAYDLTLVENDAINHDNSSRLQDVNPGCTTPMGLALAKTNIYASCALSNNVAVFDSAAPAAITLVPVGASPYGITANSTGSHVYVANAGDSTNRVMIIDTAKLTDAPIPFNVSGLGGYACSVAQSSDPAVSRFLVTNVPLVEANSTTNYDVISEPFNGGVPTNFGSPATQIVVGVNPCSLGNFMGPMLPYTLTLNYAGGTIDPDHTANSTVGKVRAAANSYKTFTLTPTAPNTSVLAVTDDLGNNYGAAEKFTVGPINSDIIITATFTSLTKYDLTANVVGGGYCTIGSVPQGVNVYPPANSGIGNFVAATDVQLTAAAFNGSTFKGWAVGAGSCDSVSPNGYTCYVRTPAAAKTVTATCEITPPSTINDVKRGTKYYDTIALAMADYTNTDPLIKIAANPVNAQLPLDCNYGAQTVTFEGGWNFTTDTKSGASILQTGTLTITAGTVTAENITIQ